MTARTQGTANGDGQPPVPRVRNPGVGRASVADGEHDLAEGAVCFAVLVGRSGVGEGVGGVDDRAQLLVCDELGNGLHAGEVGFDEHSVGAYSECGCLVSGEVGVGGEKRDEGAAAAHCGEESKGVFAAERVEHDVDVVEFAGEVGVRW